MDETRSGREASEAYRVIERVRAAMAGRLVGKGEIVDAILTAVMSDGHLLLEGVPGLAKTLAVRTFAAAAGLSYRRIQFTPDLLPGDITGTLFYDAASGAFVPRRGPVFANIVLADEINRAPAKVQSALLEAMEERQVTMGDHSLPLPEPFFVLATQNPIEHEGTFRLPEAQLDRFMLKVVVDYPDEAEELDVVLRYADRPAGKADEAAVQPVIGQAEIAALKAAAASVRFERDAAAYAVAVVRATRPSRDGKQAAGALRELSRYIEYGASPRGSIALYRAARAAALLAGRDYVLPDDVKRSAPAALRHRVIPSYEAEADRVGPDAIVKGVLSAVPVP
ncbi:MAG TPA: AAA family ATPase [Spirochaetales bacterium]|nr:AAA family ATPase [Spirochaetales bacterium]HPG87634.1 AAA family ATPase [Spirochaetales bacterium]HPM71776.1 AAA family ATPase [Spirochaetales bacterium]